MRSATNSNGCFLIGSGPSLNSVDIQRLKSVDTIAFNRSYVAWREWGFAPTLYACLDPRGIENVVDDVPALLDEHVNTTFFLSDRAAAFGVEPSSRVFHVSLTRGRAFSTDLAALTDFGNVGATAIQILAILDYRRITLIGVDARYVHVTGPALSEDGSVPLVDDLNYFHPEYVRQRSPVSPDDLARI